MKSAPDILLDGAGAAGVMGCINNVGSGYGNVPKAYYMRVPPNAVSSLMYYAACKCF